MTPTLVVLLLPAAAALALPSVPTDEFLSRVSPVTLAYIGDAVFELAARERLCWPPAKIDALSSQVTARVCAEGQHAVMQRVRSEFGLTEEELEWLRRGRNASSRGPRRLDPKVYRESSAMETLIGYLYTVDRARLDALLEFCFETPLPEEDDGDSTSGGGGAESSN